MLRGVAGVVGRWSVARWLVFINISQRCSIYYGLDASPSTHPTAARPQRRSCRCRWCSRNGSGTPPGNASSPARIRPEPPAPHSRTTFRPQSVPTGRRTSAVPGRDQQGRTRPGMEGVPAYHRQGHRRGGRPKRRALTPSAPQNDPKPLRAENAARARICGLYGHFSGPSDRRFFIFNHQRPSM